MKKVTIVGIRIKKPGKVYYFDPGKYKFNIGDFVIVETALGEEYAEVVIPNKEVSEDRIVTPLKPVKRKATEKDKKHDGHHGNSPQRGIHAQAQGVLYPFNPH